MQSHSVKVGPADARCRYWAKLIRNGESLPLPTSVQGANDVPAQYLKRGDEELLAGDLLLEGEANHHRRTDRGWTYSLTAVTKEGAKLRFQSGFAQQKAQMKAQGMAPELLKGAGDVAAMVRIGHGLRAGLSVTPGA